MTIKELRQSKHMTWKEFAKCLGVSVSTVARWESGASKPGMNAIVNIGLVFGDEKAEEIMMEVYRGKFNQQ